MENNSEPTDQKETPATSNENSQESEISSRGNDEEEEDCPKNLEIDEIDDDELTKMKGDAIGDTLYSERFVLKALMELKELDVEKGLDASMVSVTGRKLNVMDMCN